MDHFSHFIVLWNDGVIYRTLLRQRNWKESMEEGLLIERRQRFVHDGSAYLIRPWMHRPFIRYFVTLSQLPFNTEVSSLRMLVEHDYIDSKQNWTNQDCAQNMKVRLAPIRLL